LVCRGMAERVSMYRTLAPPMIGYAFDHRQVEVVVDLGDTRFLEGREEPRPWVKNIPIEIATRFQETVTATLEDEPSDMSVEDMVKRIAQVAREKLIRPGPARRSFDIPIEIRRIKRDLSKAFVVKALIRDYRAAEAGAETRQRLSRCRRSRVVQWACCKLDIPLPRHAADILELYEANQDQIKRLYTVQSQWYHDFAHAVMTKRSKDAKMRSRKQLYVRATGAPLSRPFIAARTRGGEIVSERSEFLSEVAQQMEEWFTPAPVDLDRAAEIIARTPVRDPEIVKQPLRQFDAQRIREGFKSARVVARDAEGLNAEAWRWVPDAVIDRLVDRINRDIRETGQMDPYIDRIVAWVKDKGHSDPYQMRKRRPVENQTALGRELGRILFKDEVMPAVMELVSPKHFGARPGRSIGLAAIMVQCVIEYAGMVQNDLTIVSLDMREMFVRPVHKVTRMVFKNRIADEAAEVIISSFENRTVSVQTDRGSTRFTKPKCGFGQGQCPSPQAAIIYNDGVTRRVDRGTGSQEPWRRLTAADRNEMRMEGIPVIGGIPVGCVVLTDDHLAFRCKEPEASAMAQTACDEMRAMGGDCQPDKLFAVVYNPSGEGRLSVRRVSEVTCDGVQVRTHFGSAKKELKGFIPKHGGFPIESRGRCPALYTEKFAEFTGVVNRLSSNEVFMSTSDLGVVLAAGLQQRVSYLGATLLLAPDDLRSLDNICERLLRQKLSIAKGTTPQWYYAPTNRGGMGWLTTADRTWREFLIAYKTAYNDRMPDGEIRQVKRTVDRSTRKGEGYRLANIKQQLTEMTNAEWAGARASEKLAIVAQHFSLEPTTPEQYCFKPDRGDFRFEELPNPDMDVEGVRLVAGTDGALKDGDASWGLAYATETLDEVWTQSDRLVGVQDVHRSELVAILILLTVLELAASVVIFVDRDAATDAIKRAQAELRENPNALQRTPEGGVLLLIVARLEEAEKEKRPRKLVSQRSHEVDSVPLEQLRDKEHPGPFMNRVADEKADEALLMDAKKSHVYRGECDDQDLIFVNEEDIVVTSLKKEIKVAAQAWHLQYAFEDDAAEERRFFECVDDELINAGSVEERLSDIVHSTSYAPFGRPNLKDLPQWRAFFAFRHDLVFSDVARAKIRADTDEPFCTMCEAGIGTVEHYLSECRAPVCVEARQNARDSLERVCAEWQGDIAVPRIVSREGFLREWDEGADTDLLTTRGHLSREWVLSVYDSLYVNEEEPTEEDMEEAKLLCFKVLEVIAGWQLELRRTVCVAVAHAFSGNYYGGNDDDDEDSS
jgi:hypothetical protein